VGSTVTVTSAGVVADAGDTVIAPEAAPCKLAETLNGSASLADDVTEMYCDAAPPADPLPENARPELDRTKSASTTVNVTPTVTAAALLELIVSVPLYTPVASPA